MGLLEYPETLEPWKHPVDTLVLRVLIYCGDVMNDVCDSGVPAGPRDTVPMIPGAGAAGRQ